MKKMVFGERLADLRKKRNLSQYALAAKFNISQSTLAMWEKGNRSPSNTTIANIAKYFDVSTDYLLGVTDDPTPGDRQMKLFKLHENELDYYTEHETRIRLMIAQKTSEISTIQKHIDSIEQNADLDLNEKRNVIDILNKSIDTFNEEIDSLSNELTHPFWATSKDKRDLKKFLENPEGLYFDGIEFSEDDRNKLLGMMESMFWEARRQNKEAYKKSREKKKDQ